jgi:tripeptidyl-peptidase-1
MFSLRYAVQALLLSASAVVAIQPFEQLSEVPRGWSLVGAAKDATAIKLRLSLKQQNVDKFYEEMLAVSTPDNAKYGKHYEGLELRSLLAPTDETSNTVISWLLDNNITSIADDGDWIVLQTNVGAANKLLNTEFQWFSNAEEKAPVLRTLQYSVPDEIASHINFVQPTTRFGGIQKLKSTVQIVEEGQAVSSLKWTPSVSSKVDPACNVSITPTCLLQLYNVHYKGDPKSGSRVGYASFLEEYARYSDLEKFEDAYAPYAAGQNFTVIKFNGGLDDQNSTDDSGEANLDNQYALSLGFPNPVTEFSVGGRGLLIPDGDSPTPSDNTNEPYLDFLLALLKLPNSKIPQVISISYGENEQVGR